MTEELAKAAQQAIHVLQHYIHGGSEYRKPAEAAIAALERALTQRPAPCATPMWSKRWWSGGLVVTPESSARSQNH